MSPEKPRRNLTQAFEALCAISPEETVKEEKSADVLSPPVKAAEGVIISPTAVAEFPVNDDYNFSSSLVPNLNLHKDLALDLSDQCVSRVSCYSIIHDINKEAVAMAAHDPVVVNLEHEKDSALVLTALGQQQQRHDATTNVQQEAVIDEEQWLLATIAERKEASQAACPATFAQAMGEKEYPLLHSRTQLWKPSRSWWEAKSGKNPWIEPASHNKRWRYLWPLIHYHKFLAKCIKKLKRNGVDVKVSLSPVTVFLREEVCAVSDHLATVSHFGSDQWMDCLPHFTGWTVLCNDATVQQYRTFISRLPLRGLLEPGDVESPLLRSQIDEAFLRTMQAQRDQLREAATAVLTSVASPSSCSKKKKSLESPTDPTAPAPGGPPPMYPRGPSEHQQQPQVPRQIHGVRRPRYYPNGWYGWEHPDTSSVHSELSANSYPAQAPSGYDGYHQHMYMMQYYPYGSNHSPQPPTGYDPRYGGWMDPAMAYYHQQGYFPSPAPPTPYHEQPESIDESAEQQTPFKYDPENMNMSPYWSHLDQATLAMGLATPAKASPSTPRRNENRDDDHQEHDFAGAQAPLIRQHYYNGYHHPTDAAASNGYAPPSPATQFMMSPQASFAYNYGYGFSPRRPRLSKQLEEPDRSHSPSTVETTPESESDAAPPQPVDC